MQGSKQTTNQIKKQQQQQTNTNQPIINQKAKNNYNNKKIPTSNQIKTTNKPANKPLANKNHQPTNQIKKHQPTK